MTITKKHSEYEIHLIAQKAIGHGNYVTFGEVDIGPVSLPKHTRESLNFISSGAGSISIESSGTRIPAKKAFSRTAKALKNSFTELQIDLSKARRESGIFFTLMCAFSIIGFSLVLGSFLLLFFGMSQESIIGTTVSAISEILALVYFKKDRELRQVLESYHSQMYSYNRFLTKIDITETIEADEVRNELKKQILSELIMPNDNQNNNSK